MKKLFAIIFVLFFAVFTVFAQKPIPKDEIWLLVRGDDIGSSHAANVGCIDSYKNGIMRSVEVMVPCPWFPEAVQMLNENPGLDVGIHLVMTSEWNNMKWRPLTCAPSIVDSNGYFQAMVWKNDNFPNNALQGNDWKIEDIEAELRAQIEMAIKNIPHVTHMGCHMGCAGLDPKISEVERKLAQEYGLEFNREDYEIKRLKGYERDKPTDVKIDQFAKNISELTPGLYMFVEHPALDTPEMEAIWHIGYEGVGKDRDDVTKVFTSEKVKKAIKDKNIKLVSYKDLLEL